MISATLPFTSVTVPAQRGSQNIPVYGEHGVRVSTCLVLPGEEPPAYLERSEIDDHGDVWETTYLLIRHPSGSRYVFAEALG